MRLPTKILGNFNIQTSFHSQNYNMHDLLSSCNKSFSNFKSNLGLSLGNLISCCTDICISLGNHFSGSCQVNVFHSMSFLSQNLDRRIVIDGDGARRDKEFLSTAIVLVDSDDTWLQHSQAGDMRWEDTECSRERWDINLLDRSLVVVDSVRCSKSEGHLGRSWSRSGHHPAESEGGGAECHYSGEELKVSCRSESSNIS